MSKPHKHAELIKAWADGAEIQGRPDRPQGNWVDFKVGTEPPYWRLDWEYRVKPPREFPKTSLTGKQLARIAYPNAFDDSLDKIADAWGNTMYKRIADAAIKQYILENEKCLRQSCCS